MRLGEGKYSRHRNSVYKNNLEWRMAEGKASAMCCAGWWMFMHLLFSKGRLKVKRAKLHNQALCWRQGKLGGFWEIAVSHVDGTLRDTSPPMLFWSSWTSAKLIIGLCGSYKNQCHREFVMSGFKCPRGTTEIRIEGAIRYKPPWIQRSREEVFQSLISNGSEFKNPSFLTL